MARRPPAPPSGGGSAATPRALVAGADHLPEPVKNRGISQVEWATLKNNLYPGASNESVLMVIDYCRARKLDPLKKPCHIVPMRVRDSETGEWAMRDVVMPGIYEYRTTAQRTGEYLGHAIPEYGPAATVLGVEAPAWCDFTVYRWNPASRMRAEFPVRVRFDEVVATRFDKETKAEVVNDRWSKAPMQMLTKCAEAAALRAAFPDELGGEHTIEEMAGRDLGVAVIEGEVVRAGKAGVQMPQRKDAAQPGAGAGQAAPASGAQGSEAKVDPNDPFVQGLERGEAAEAARAGAAPQGDDRS